MTDEIETLVINVNVEITASSIEAIVYNVKKNMCCDAKGIYRVDTADKVSQMISRFLFENNFENYAKNNKNYL